MWLNDNAGYWGISARRPLLGFQKDTNEYLCKIPINVIIIIINSYQ